MRLAFLLLTLPLRSCLGMDPMVDVYRADSATSTTQTQRNLGIAHDAVSMGERGVSFGFNLARQATNMGFGIAASCLKRPAELMDQAMGPNAVSQGLQGVGMVVDIAHKATIAGQDVSLCITQASLGITKVGLKAAGAREGELLRLMVGDEAAETIIAVEALVRSFAGPLAGVPVAHAMEAARAWGVLQQAGSPLVGGAEVAELPEHSERWVRYAAATLGATWLAGLVEGFSISAVARARAAGMQNGGPGEQALACAGIEGHVEVLAFEQSQLGLFKPGYLVAVDYEHEQVVVALRGTSSVADVLADLVCKPVALTLGGHEGLAHEGMLRAAQRLDAALAALVERGLERLRLSSDLRGPPRVLVTGHSLGAGVAALVTALWRDSGRFPGVSVRCIAFACPQILDADLAASLSNHTTSIIAGDDLVPRLSLATATDLRSAMLLLSNPADHGLDPSLHMRHVFASADRGEANHLADVYLTIRQAACTAPNRLFPPGRLIHLVSGRAPQACSPSTFDELLISPDMAAAHMPRRYLSAIQESLSEGRMR